MELHRVDPADPLAVAAIESYYDELRLRFPDGFAPGATALDEGVFVVGTDAGEAVACGGLQPLVLADGRPAAEVKRMWVHPEHRGLGYGGRLLRHLEALAAELGHTRVVLDTNDRLTEAIAMYERAGYLGVPAYNDNPYARYWFAKELS